MLCVNNYERTYIDECRRRVESQLCAYDELIAATTKQAATDKTRLNTAIDGFESVFFSNMVLALDASFMHRSRTIEKKDGNPLNEVRMLSNSIA